MISKDWWRGGIVYEIYPRSFRDTNGDGIGDLPGITEKLGHIASLGVDCIWIAPFAKSPQRDFGYDVSDYRAVDPQFGTLEDFDVLVKKAHALGLKVLTDYVISHTSDQHPWFIESRSSRDNPKADWYVWADMKPEGSPPNNWLSVFGGSSWQWDTRRLQYYLHNFLTSQPDLNYYNPAVQDAALAEMRFWLDRGVDGFRLDALNFAMHDPLLRDNPPAQDPSASEQPITKPYAWQQHLYDKSQSALLPFLARIRSLLNEYGATTSLAEVGDDNVVTLKLMADYAGSGDKVHMCYGFDFLADTCTPAHFRNTIERFEREAGDAAPCWAFSNHDCIRHVTRWTKPGGDPAVTAKFAIGLMLALRGSLCLYQGEELGLTEANLNFEDLKDPPGIEFWPVYKGRDGCRTPFPWDAGQENAGFGKGIPWLPVEPAHLQYAAASEEADPNSVLNFYRRAIKIRQESAALRNGSIEFLEATETLLVIRRRAGDEVVTCVYNFGVEPFAAPTEYAGERILQTGRGSSVLEPFGFVWLRS
jgi:alpha-glucosidase